MESVPTVRRDSDALGYDADFCRTCMPYLLASMLATDEDRDLANVYLKTYARLVETFLHALPETITDWYEEVSA